MSVIIRSPDSINDYPIIAYFPTPGDHATRAGLVILVKRDQSPHPYVTAWLANGDTSWCWGHYFDNMAEAKEDYVDRCRRGY